jgi:hypothetical protein
MSTTFFIAPFDPRAWEDPEDTSPKPTSDLSINPSEYRAKLLERWPQMTFIHTLPVLNWELPLEDGEYSGLSGHLQTNLQIVEFGTGPKKSFVDFILWHRSVIPEQYPLYLFNSSSWDSLLLTNDTSEQDVVDFTGMVS